MNEDLEETVPFGIFYSFMDWFIISLTPTRQDQSSTILLWPMKDDFTRQEDTCILPRKGYINGVGS